MALTVTKDELLSRIGRKIGYGDTTSNWNAQESRDAARVLDDAMRRCYEPVVLPGEREKHQWSFLMPIRPYTFEAGKYVYDMPSDFTMLNGVITYAPGLESLYPPIEITAAEKVMNRLQQGTAAGRPLIAALRPKPPDGVDTTAYELIVWPVPDDNYEIALPYRINPYSLESDTSLPIGGQPFMQTLIDACMMESARFDELPDFPVYEATFVNSLRSAVSHDRRVSNPERMGYCGDNSDNIGAYSVRDFWNQSSITTYNGVIP